MIFIKKTCFNTKCRFRDNPAWLTLNLSNYANSYEESRKKEVFVSDHIESLPVRCFDEIIEIYSNSCKKYIYYKWCRPAETQKNIQIYFRDVNVNGIHESCIFCTTGDFYKLIICPTILIVCILIYANSCIIWKLCQTFNYNMWRTYELLALNFKNFIWTFPNVIGRIVANLLFNFFL